MESRSRRYEISRPQPIPPPPPPAPPLPPPPAVPAPNRAPRDSPPAEHAPWVSIIPRPLSDIRELSEPSLIDHVARHQPRHRRSQSKAQSIKRSDSVQRSESLKAPTAPTKLQQPNYQLQQEASSSYSSTPEQASFYSIPQSSVPRRSSSFQRQARNHARKPSIRPQPSSSLAPPPKHGYSIPNYGTSQSPVKEAGLRLDPITSDAARRIPSKTHIRAPHPSDILDFPSHKHPRVKLQLQVSAPLFVGGGTVEGFVRATIDDNEAMRHRRSISIGALSVDLLGFEQMSNNRKATFLALGTELIDREHPPPPKMIQPVDALFAEDKFWCLAPSCSALPFMISLPLDTGPPPFQSKHAQIRFMLSATALIRDSGKHYRVRTSQDVQVLPTYDPEKALTSLTSPLTASDEICVSRPTGQEVLRVTAGLHRQVWVSGSSIFVDVHISNKTHKPVKKLDLTLERDILCYKHVAAATLEKSAGQARIFESNEQAILARATFKPGLSGWHGVEPHTSDTRTCELELPRGHGTVRCGKYFEVRYFLNVAASLSTSKQVSIQLPIILIHMNSIDVVPNSVAQVAAAIEEKRAHRPRRAKGHARQRSVSSPAAMVDLKRRPSFAQGRAFAAPRQQSLDRHREQKADLDEVRNIIDSSPRKNIPVSTKGYALRKAPSTTSFSSMAFGSKSTETLGIFGAMSYSTPPNRTATTNLTNEFEALRGQIKRIGSLESMRSKMSSGRKKKDHIVKVGVVERAISHAELAPYTLGLSTTTRKVSMDAPSERSATAMSFREKLDRSRFEFKAVRRKASGGLKDRGSNWWDQRRNRDRQREREGWI